MDDPFRGIRQEDVQLDRAQKEKSHSVALYWPEELDQPDFARIDGTFHFRTVDPEALDGLLQYQFKGVSRAAFTELFFDGTGVDLEKVRENAERNREDHRRRLGDLVHRFGMEAFGTYLPWHAFVRSSTPWGVYILPARIADWADDLLQTSRHLPSPKPSWEQMFFALLWTTYRHELFHWHVEIFALAHEVLVHRPVYRPYVERVRIPISRENAKEWWEEALAQAVVLDSRLVSNRSGFTPGKLRKFLVPDFRARFGDGYRHFECKAVGGTSEAHRILSAQVARTQIAHNPTSTGLALIKDNYGKDDTRVPGYFCFSATDFLRFQLAPVKMRHFEAYVSRNGGTFSSGPGDHRILRFGRTRIHVNAGRNRDGIDLASLKATAKLLRTSAFRLSKEIRLG